MRASPEATQMEDYFVVDTLMRNEAARAVRAARLAVFEHLGLNENSTSAFVYLVDLMIDALARNIDECGQLHAKLSYAEWALLANGRSEGKLVSSGALRKAFTTYREDICTTFLSPLGRTCLTLSIVTPGVRGRAGGAAAVGIEAHFAAGHRNIIVERLSVAASYLPSLLARARQREDARRDMESAVRAFAATVDVLLRSNPDIDLDLRQPATRALDEFRPPVRQTIGRIVRRREIVVATPTSSGAIMPSPARRPAHLKHEEIVLAALIQDRTLREGRVSLLHETNFQLDRARLVFRAIEAAREDFQDESSIILKLMEHRTFPWPVSVDYVWALKRRSFTADEFVDALDRVVGTVSAPHAMWWENPDAAPEDPLLRLGHAIAHDARWKATFDPRFGGFSRAGGLLSILLAMLDLYGDAEIAAVDRADRHVHHYICEVVCALADVPSTSFTTYPESVKARERMRANASRLLPLLEVTSDPVANLIRDRLTSASECLWLATRVAPASNYPSDEQTE